MNVFSLSWHGLRVYVFPPFCVILQVFQKVKRDRATEVIFMPSWLMQMWWPVLMRMLIRELVPLPVKDDLLSLPRHLGKKHPLRPRSLECISGQDYMNKASQTVQQIS